MNSVSFPCPFNLGLDMTRRIDDLLDEVRNAETLLQNARYFYYTVKKRLAVFPSPAANFFTVYVFACYQVGQTCTLSGAGGLLIVYYNKECRSNPLLGGGWYMMS